MVQPPDAAPPVKKLLDLSGKVALVTGASAGIGHGIATRLAEAGSAVAVHYRGGEADAKTLCAWIEAAGGRAFAVHMEVTDPRSIDAGLAAVKKALGPVDILVNNAARQTHSTLADMDLEEWRGMMTTNLDGVFLLSKRVIAEMVERKSGGAIINIASISGLNSTITHAHYATSKAGLIMFTRAAAEEFGPYGIRVNAVSPGVIYRQGIEEAWPSGVKRWMDVVPLKRMGESSDIGDAVLFLASPASRFITGANLVVDGGVSVLSTY
jgi:NAD(P)-dependent dehydrogenase (short-subunit alcohol dehydrogenase family)